MGTTLALSGAYNLAGALMQHPNDHTAAFAQYEEKMRPTVTKAQKLAPGMPKLMSPETAWGIWVFHAIFWCLSWIQVMKVIVAFVGPPAHSVPVEDYGFRDLPEFKD